jgi:hypothetical protein
MLNQSKTQPRCAPTAPGNPGLLLSPLLDTLSHIRVEPPVPPGKILIFPAFSLGGDVRFDLCE